MTTTSPVVTENFGLGYASVSLKMWGRKCRIFPSAIEPLCVPKICWKCVCGWGSTPDPAGGAQAHDAPPDLQVGWGGDTPERGIPLPTPRLRLRRLDPRTFGAGQSATPHCFLDKSNTGICLFLYHVPVNFRKQHRGLSAFLKNERNYILYSQKNIFVPTTLSRLALLRSIVQCSLLKYNERMIE